MCLNAAALRGPVSKILHLVAILPEDFQKLRGVGAFRFFAQKSFKAPAEIGTVPRMQAIAAGCNPIISKSVQHREEWFAERIAERWRNSSHRGRKMLVHNQPGWATFFPNPSVTDFGFGRLSVLRREGEVHGNSCPCDVSASRDFQIFSCR